MSGDGPAWLRALGDLFKPRRLAAIWVVALLVLLLPRSLWSALRVDAFVEQFRPWIVGAFLVFLSFWTFELLPAATGRWREERRATKRTRLALKTLTPQESEWLRETYRRGTKTVAMSSLSDVAQLLERRHLIVRIAPASNSAGYYFEVVDGVWRELGR